MAGKVCQGNQIIKLAPFLAPVSDYFASLWKFVPTVSVASAALIPLEGAAQRAFAKDNTSQRNF